MSARITCPVCDRPFMGDLVRRTDDGFRHAPRCPRALTDDRLEDLAWMAKTGEHLDGAAERLGMTPHALERALERAGLLDLRRILASRNPRDWNAFMRKDVPA